MLYAGCGSCLQCNDPYSDEIFCMGREQRPPQAKRTFGTGMNVSRACNLNHT